MSNEEIIAEIKAGKNRRDNLEKLWKQNGGMFHNIALQFSFMSTYEDIKQELFIIMCDLIETYDQDRGKFTTYFFKCVGDQLRRSCYTDIIDVPQAVRSELLRYNDFLALFYDRVGRNPTPAEITRLTGFKRDKIRKLEALDGMLHPTSTDKVLQADDNDAGTIGDKLPDNVDIETEVLERAYNEQRAQDVREAVDKLPADQREVITRHYRDGESLQGMAERTGTTRAIIASTEAKALRTLRKDKTLKGYMPECALNIAYHGSLSRFNTTWTSSTEAATFRMLEHESEMKDIIKKLYEIPDEIIDALL